MFGVKEIKMRIIVTTASGIEAVTKREIFNIIGKEDLACINGRISFDGTIEDVVNCNLKLRTAGRVLIEVCNVKAENFDELFDGVYSADWQNYIPKNGKILVTAKCVQSKLHAISATQSVSKKAIVNKLSGCYNCTLKEDGERYKVDVSVYKDYASVTLDTSGEGLHKRGYRGLVGEAPLKETLASAIIQLSVWNPERPFADVFCGSGTFPIEAALIAKNIPSGLNRDFDFLHYDWFDKKIYEEIKNKAISEIKTDVQVKISGFDIDEKQIALARRHAEEAGVKDCIHFQRMDMREFSSSHKRGVIITNPPYGERLMTRQEIVGLYRDFGKTYSKLDDWCCYVLTSVSDFENLFGKRSDKKRKIYNGNLECNLYRFLAKLPKKDKNM